jgi:hypothetical protein
MMRQEDKTMSFRSIAFRLLFSCLAVSAASPPALGVVERLSLSEPLEQLESRLSTPPASTPRPTQPARLGVTPYALILDRDSLDPKSTDALLTAITDLRAAGGSVIAICPKASGSIGRMNASGGVAVIALACDAVVFESGASLEGAATGWCTSASKRKEISDKLATLGRIDPLLASSIVDCSTGLSWSAAGGFKSSTGGEVELAQANQPIVLSAAILRSIAVQTQEFKSVADAVAAIERGAVGPRSKGVPKAPGFGSGSGSGSGTGSGSGSGTPATAPADSAKPQAPAIDPDMQAKVDAKLKEYDATLAELKRDLDAFDRFFTGTDGTWTTGNRGLKEVWQDKSDNTRHGETKLKCERLQRSLKEDITSLGRTLKSVDRMIKNREHPTYLRLKANQESLDGLREALERNQVDDYERFSKEAKKLM